MTLRMLWADSWFRWSLVVLVLYVVLALGVSFFSWDEPIATGFQSPRAEGLLAWFGTDILGRSVLLKTFYGIQVALIVGLFGALIAVLVGSVLGALAGFFGGWFDHLVVWLMTAISAIPGILLVMVFAMALGKGLVSVCFAIGLTFWVGLARVVRGEVMKLREMDYVTAAQAVGASSGRQLFHHILPNFFHHSVIFFSLYFQSAIKYEVILSFLGLGVQNRPSWGLMLNDARLEMFRSPTVWWQLTAATLAMFFWF